MSDEIQGGFFVSNETEIKPLKTGKVALLDADYMKYVLTDRIWKAKENGDYGYFDDYGQNFVDFKIKELIDNWLYKIQDPIIFCFSGKSFQTFRNSVCFEKKYKGNREGRDDPRFYEGKIEDMYRLVEYVKKNNVSLLFSDLEADDILSCLQDERTYIVSKDKDLKQVPGYHYDFDSNQTYEITQDHALYNLSIQLLTGDTTDNIPGLPQVGPKKAEKLLSQSNASNRIPIILRAYQEKYGIFKGTDMFVEMWNLIKMRENRGEHFRQKYQKMFDLKEMVINSIQL